MPIDPDLNAIADAVDYAGPTLDSVRDSLNGLLSGLKTVSGAPALEIEVPELPVFSMEMTGAEFVSALNTMREALNYRGITRAPTE